MGDHQMKYICLLIVIASVFISCSKRSEDVPMVNKYIDLMSELSCRRIVEGTDEAKEFMESKGLSYEKVEEFRKNTKPEILARADAAVARRATSCLGTNQM